MNAEKQAFLDQIKVFESLLSDASQQLAEIGERYQEAQQANQRPAANRYWQLYCAHSWHVAELESAIAYLKQAIERNDLYGSVNHAINVGLWAALLDGAFMRLGETKRLSNLKPRAPTVTDDQIKAALEEHETKAEAARHLGISERALYSRLKLLKY